MDLQDPQLPAKAAESAQELARAVSFMAQRIQTLEAQNAALRQQLELVQQHGGVAFNPETAKAWIASCQAADPALWKRIETGNSATAWDKVGGFAASFSLQGLWVDLLSIPGDDSWHRSLWDMGYRKVRPDLVGKYPRRFSAGSYLLPEVMGEAPSQVFLQLTKGMRDGSKAKLFLQVVFALLKEDAITMLNTEPVAVMQRVIAEMGRAYGWQRERDAETWSRLFSGALGQGAERTKALKTLGLADEATAEEIKARYRELAKLHHPDTGGDADAFAAVADAYNLLSA